MRLSDLRTRHASQFGDITGLYERGAASNTQEEADHLVGHLEAMSVSFELAAKYAEDIPDLRIQLAAAEHKLKPPATALEWELLLRDLSPGQREAFQNLIDVFRKEREAEKAAQTETAESTDTSRILEEFEL
jgi:hypothetical protein